VDVSRGRGFGGVHVAVRVKPEVADLLFFLAEMVGDAGGHACGDGMVTAENEREKTFIKDFSAAAATSLQVSAISCKYLARFSADGHLFRLLDGKIADVFDLEAELLDAGLEPAPRRAEGPCRRRGGSGRGPWGRR